jgi:hypothetical protein
MEVFEREREALLKEHGRGKHALLYGDQVHGVYDSRGDALEEGFRRFGCDRDHPFMVKEVLPEEEEEIFILGPGPVMSRTTRGWLKKREDAQ